MKKVVEVRIDAGILTVVSKNMVVESLREAKKFAYDWVMSDEATDTANKYRDDCLYNDGSVDYVIDLFVWNGEQKGQCNAIIFKKLKRNIYGEVVSATDWSIRSI